LGHKKAQKAQNAERVLLHASQAFYGDASQAFYGHALLTPKAFANSSPGLERKRQPWVINARLRPNPERVKN